MCSLCQLFSRCPSTDFNPHNRSASRLSQNLRTLVLRYLLASRDGPHSLTHTASYYVHAFIPATVVVGFITKKPHRREMSIRPFLVLCSHSLFTRSWTLLMLILLGRRLVYGQIEGCKSALQLFAKLMSVAKFSPRVTKKEIDRITRRRGLSATHTRFSDTISSYYCIQYALYIYIFHGKKKESHLQETHNQNSG